MQTSHAFAQVGRGGSKVQTGDLGQFLARGL